MKTSLEQRMRIHLETDEIEAIDKVATLLRDLDLKMTTIDFERVDCDQDRYSHTDIKIILNFLVNLLSIESISRLKEESELEPYE